VAGAQQGSDSTGFALRGRYSPRLIDALFRWTFEKLAYQRLIPFPPGLGCWRFCAANDMPMKTSFRHALIYFALSFLVGLAMITTESIWIDEGQTWRFAHQPTFEDWYQTLLHNMNSEAQMPLSMFIAWVCGKGIGEQWRAGR
jgi:hypothetical protein